MLLSLNVLIEEIRKKRRRLLERTVRVGITTFRRSLLAPAFVRFILIACMEIVFGTFPSAMVPLRRGDWRQKQTMLYAIAHI